MEYLHAALLLHSAKQKITADGITKIIKAAGLTPDEARVKSLVAVLEDVNIDEAIKTAPMMAAAPVAAAAAAPAAAAEEGKGKGKGKAAAKEQKAEEEGGSDLGLDSLFG